MTERKCCPWYDMCIYKTAVCMSRYPDEGCFLFRWFKERIRNEAKMEDFQMKINAQMRLINEDEDKFIFETIRTYTDGVLAHEGIIKIPKKLLTRAIICFRNEHPEEFEILLKEGEEEEQNGIHEN